MNQNDKLTRFTSVIESDAKGESERILENVRREMDGALAAAEDGILNESFRYIKTEVSRARTASWRKISRRIMEDKNALNSRREQMSEIVMERVTARLAEYVGTEDYVRGLIKSARAILAEFSRADTVLYLREADAALEQTLRDALKDERFTVETGDFELGGLMGTCPATHIQIDESFDTKLGELRGHFAELFGLQLSL